MKIFGKEYDFSELIDYVGDMKTIAGVKPYTLFDGPEKGVFAIDVWTGSGLNYTVVPDRGMNICNVKYKGIPLDWMSGTGLTSPFLYEFHGWNWLRSFYGGLVHTCGFNNVGDPCKDMGVSFTEEDFGAHGRISNTPARELSWSAERGENTYKMIVAGKCRIISVQGENLLLERKILSELGGTELTLKDKITNLGSNRTPVFLLYHCNFGFPLLSPDSTLSIPSEKTVDLKEKTVSNFENINSPRESDEEEVLFPVINEDPVIIKLFNPKIGNNGVGINITYSKSELPCLTIWKFFQKRSYVLGVEPGTCHVEGRKVEKKKNRAIFLDKDESIHITLKFTVYEAH